MVRWEVMTGIILGSLSLALFWSYRLNRQQHKAQRALGFYRITVYSKREMVPFLIVIGIIAALWASPYLLYEPPPPPFIGYQSPTTRIDPVNLTEIVRARKNNEISTNITIHTEHRDEREYVEWDRFMGKGNARISFANVKTKYSYNFNGNDEKTTLPIFWTKLKKYLHLSDEELQSEIFKFNKRVEEQSFGYDRYANGAIDWKKPDYELILADLGEILDFDNSEIGFETTIYKDTTWSEYNTKCIVRSRFYTKYLVVETEIENPSASIVLLIDGDSDIQIEIWCREKLDDPTTVLVDLFDQIGIPTTILDSLELEEWYSGYY